MVNPMTPYPELRALAQKAYNDEDELLAQNRDAEARICRKHADELTAALDRMQEGEPLNMVLHCPACGMQHIDAPEPRYADNGADDTTWHNPPHRSHLCANCGCIWRPADVATNGVRVTQTKGGADTWGGESMPWDVRTPPADRMRAKEPPK